MHGEGWMRPPSCTDVRFNSDCDNFHVFTRCRRIARVVVLVRQMCNSTEYYFALLGCVPLVTFLTARVDRLHWDLENFIFKQLTSTGKEPVQISECCFVETACALRVGCSVYVCSCCGAFARCKIHSVCRLVAWLKDEAFQRGRVESTFFACANYSCAIWWCLAVVIQVTHILLWWKTEVLAYYWCIYSTVYIDAPIASKGQFLMFVCVKTHALPLYEGATLVSVSYGGVPAGHFLNENIVRLLFLNAGRRHFDIVPTARQKALIKH